MPPAPFLGGGRRSFIGESLMMPTTNIKLGQPALRIVRTMRNEPGANAPGSLTLTELCQFAQFADFASSAAICSAAT